MERRTTVQEFPGDAREALEWVRGTDLAVAGREGGPDIVLSTGGPCPAGQPNPDDGEDRMSEAVLDDAPG